MAIRYQAAGVAGWIGSTFAALCCIGFSVLAGLVGAIGAGFLLQDRVLIPILVVSLILSVIGLVGAFRKRGNFYTLSIGSTGIALTLISVLSAWSPGVYLGLIALLLATTWNVRDGILDHRKEIDDTRKAA